MSCPEGHRAQPLAQIHFEDTNSRRQRPGSSLVFPFRSRTAGSGRVAQSYSQNLNYSDAFPIEAPPSTKSVWPVIKAASSERKNSIAAAISSSWPSRPIRNA